MEEEQTEEEVRDEFSRFKVGMEVRRCFTPGRGWIGGGALGVVESIGTAEMFVRWVEYGLERYTRTYYDRATSILEPIIDEWADELVIKEIG